MAGLLEEFIGITDALNKRSIDYALEDVWKDRRRVKWNSGEYKIVSAKGMIAMKEMAGRPKDMIDLDYLRGLDDED